MASSLEFSRKRQAEREIERSGVDYTIIRPGGYTIIRPGGLHNHQTWWITQSSDLVGTQSSDLVDYTIIRPGGYTYLAVIMGAHPYRRAAHLCTTVMLGD